MAKENSDNSITEPLLDSIKVAPSSTGSPIGSEQDGTKERLESIKVEPSFTGSPIGSEQDGAKERPADTDSGTLVGKSSAMPSFVFGSEQNGTGKRSDADRLKASETLVGESSTMTSHGFGSGQRSRKRLDTDSFTRPSTYGFSSGHDRSRPRSRFPASGSVHHGVGLATDPSLTHEHARSRFRRTRSAGSADRFRMAVDEHVWFPATGSVTVIMELKWMEKCALSN